MTTWSEQDSGRAHLAEQPGFLLFALFLIFQLTAASLLQVAHVPFGLVFAEVFLFAAPVVLWCMATNHRPVSFLRLGRPKASLLGLGFAVGAANFLAAGALQVLVRALAPGLSLHADPLHLFRDASSLELALLVVAVGLFAPLGEEIAFRGYLQRVFGARYGRVAGLLLTSALFSALHLDPGGLLARAELGLLFGLLALWSGSIWPAIAAHAANNLIASSLIVAALAREPAAAPSGGGDLLEALKLGLPSLVVTVLLLLSFRALAGDGERGLDEPVAAVEVDEPQLFRLSRVRRPARLTGLAALVALVAFASVGWRGAALNYLDAFTPFSRIEKRLEDSGLEEGLRQRLKQARARVREGERELAGYQTLREALAAGEKGEKGLGAPQIEAAFSEFERSGPAP